MGLRERWPSAARALGVGVAACICLLLGASAATRLVQAGGGEVAPSDGKARQDAIPAASQEGPEKRVIRGRVVWLADALQQSFGITSLPESRERALALQTADRQVWVIVEDWRGIAFRSDARLRDQPLELLVRAFRGSPAVQVIQVFALRGDGKYELDYWCATCAIALFDLRPCSCCQGPVELRARRVEAVGSGPGP